MRLISRFNPAGGIADFWNEFKRPNPYRWPILAASGLMTFGLMYAFTQERVIIPPERPQVDYITTFSEGRTDDEILASNVENQERQDAIAADRQRREELRRSLYRDLGRATGIDVDGMERELAEEEAREAAEAERQRARMMGETVDDTAQ